MTESINDWIEKYKPLKISDIFGNEEEKNIEEKSRDSRPQPTANVSEDNIQHTTINTQPNEENMEVHKLPHHVTHKKKWPEYLLEFLMLFLAVFLGFIAENIRETSVEHHKEKQFIISLMNDIKADTARIKNIIKCIGYICYLYCPHYTFY